MSDMVERVARALRAQHLRDNGVFPNARNTFDEMTDRNKKYWFDSARAAIAAMREPTEAMCAAHDRDDDILGLERNPEASWKRMIDQALK